MQSKEIFDLRTRDQHRNPVRESNDDRPRNKFHSGAQSGHAHDYQQHPRHHGAHKQTVYSVHGDNSGHDHDEGAGGPSDLRLRSTQRRNQKAGDHGAVNASLRREARRNGEGHCQRQSHQTNSDAGNYIA